MPVSRTQALHLLNRARVFYLRGGGMVPSVVTSGTRSGASVTKQAWRSQQKAEKATAPPLPVRYAGIAHPSSVLTNLRLSDLYRERKDGVLRRDIGNTERCERVFRKRPQGARSGARAGSLRRRGGNIRSTASKTNTSQLRSTAPLTKTKKVKHKSP